MNSSSPRPDSSVGCGHIARIVVPLTFGDKRVVNLFHRVGGA